MVTGVGVEAGVDDREAGADTEEEEEVVEEEDAVGIASIKMSSLLEIEKE